MLTFFPMVGQGRGISV